MIDLNIDHFNKELNYIKRPNQKQIIQYLKLKKKNTLEGMSTRLSDTEECICNLEDGIMEIIQSLEQKDK